MGAPARRRRTAAKNDEGGDLTATLTNGDESSHYTATATPAWRGESRRNPHLGGRATENRGPGGGPPRPVAPRWRTRQCQCRHLPTIASVAWGRDSVAAAAPAVAPRHSRRIAPDAAPTGCTVAGRRHHAAAGANGRWRRPVTCRPAGGGADPARARFHQALCEAGRVESGGLRRGQAADARRCQHGRPGQDQDQEDTSKRYAVHALRVTPRPPLLAAPPRARRAQAAVTPHVGAAPNTTPSPPGSASAPATAGSTVPGAAKLVRSPQNVPTVPAAWMLKGPQ